MGYRCISGARLPVFIPYHSVFAGFVTISACTRAHRDAYSVCSRSGVLLLRRGVSREQIPIVIQKLCHCILQLVHPLRLKLLRVSAPQAAYPVRLIGMGSGMEFPHVFKKTLYIPLTNAHGCGIIPMLNRGVAQFGRVLGSGPRGRWFKSSHSDPQKDILRMSFLLFRRTCAGRG